MPDLVVKLASRFPVAIIRFSASVHQANHSIYGSGRAESLVMVVCTGLRDEPAGARGEGRCEPDTAGI